MEAMDPHKIYPKVAGMPKLFAAFTSRPAPKTHINEWLGNTLARVPEHDHEIAIYLATGTHNSNERVFKDIQDYLEVQHFFWRLRSIIRYRYQIDYYPRDKEKEENSRSGFIFTFGRYSLVDLVELNSEHNNRDTD